MTQPTRILFAISALAAGPATAAAQGLAADEAAVAAHIKSLASPDSDTRAAAAAELRRLVAKYPSGTVYLSRPDDGGAAWRAKLRRVRVGMDRADVLRILPSIDGPGAASGGLHDGGSYFATWRLDEHWSATAAFYDDGELAQLPRLRKGARWVGVVHPPDFTGTWVDYHVNGQRARAVELRTGKHHGVSTHYHDSGAVYSVSHYVNGEQHGDYTGWQRDGRLAFTAHYRDGKQHGTWTHWYDSGVKHSEEHYENGRRHGREWRWYESGEPASVNDYRHGVRHGIEVSWDEGGVPHYKRRHANGELVETFENGLPVE